MNRQDYFAHTIKQQIGYSELMAIGARHFTTLTETDNRMGGLHFEASYFHKYPVRVDIELNWGDLYNVTIHELRNMNQVARIKDVYNDELQGVVVDSIEAFWESKKVSLLFGTRKQALEANFAD